MDTQLSLTQVGAIIGLVAPIVAALFWQMRSSDKKTIEILEGALVKSENQAETLLPALQQQVVGLNTTLVLLHKDIEELRRDYQSTREDLRQIREYIGGQRQR